MSEQSCLHQSTIEVPKRMLKLRIDPDRPQFHVPWFVWWNEDGKPDYRVIAEGRVEDGVRFKKCWLCGETLGSTMAFVIGPMCAVNRISAEPPSHVSCAQYAVQVCPFLTRPAMRRNDKGLPEDHVRPAGDMIERNPGACLVWITNGYKLVKADGGTGFLIKINDPIETQWYREGRRATRQEVLDSIESGIPLLTEGMPEDDSVQSVAARLAFADAVKSAMELVPA